MKRLISCGVAKIQGNDYALSTQEKKKVSFYLVDSNGEEEEGEDSAEVDFSFLYETLEEANAECSKRQKKACPYRSYYSYIKHC